MTAKHAKMLKAVDKMFATATGPFHSLVVRRGGTATQREIVVGNKIRLSWLADGTSVPIDLPAGTHTLHGFVRGKAGATWGFKLISPHEENLGGGKLGPLGVEAFDAQVSIP